jgi:hypothetical protein
MLASLPQRGRPRTGMPADILRLASTLTH